MKLIKRNKQLMLAVIILMLLSACKKNEAPNLSPLIFGAKSISIVQLKALSTKAEVQVPDGNEGKQISGVVISDQEGKNIDPKTIVLQSEETNTAGIVVQFDSIAPFKVGDRIVVNASGQKLIQQNGEIILNNVPISKAKQVGKGLINIRTCSVGEAIKNAASWNGTLITIYDGALSGSSGNYAGQLNFKETDSTAIIKLQVLPGAVFENTAYPANVSTITGILRTKGTDRFIEIRKANDVVSTAVTRILTDDMALIGVVKDQNSTVWSDPNMFSTDFETKAFLYSGMNSIVNGYGHPSIADEAFLQKDRSYFYSYSMAGNQSPFYAPGLAIPNRDAFKGIKEINITFVGSKITGTIASDTYGDTVIVKPFNPVSDIFQLSIQPTNLGYPIDVPSIISTKYTQAGVFYTVKFTIPSRRDMVKLAPNDPWSRQYFIDNIDSWLRAPGFKLTNLSTRAAADPNSYNEPYAPIVITKIEYGF